MSPAAPIVRRRRPVSMQQGCLSDRTLFDRMARPVAVLTAILGLAACQEKNAFVPPPPPEVDFIHPYIGPVSVHVEAPGRTASATRAEVRARVKGFLQARHFEPGSFVKAGAPLFSIEPEQFQAAVDAAQGQLDRAQADLGIATTNLEKRRQASQTGAVSQIDVAAAEAEAKGAAANVKIAEANLADAKRDLGYTKIASPIDGLVSKELVDIGNLVGADGATLLTTVVNDNPVLVEFEANERDILTHLASRPSADRPGYGEAFNGLALKLTLSDGTTYPHPGKLDFLDNAVDPQTGTIRLRAQFPNPDGALTSGLFVRVGLPVLKWTQPDARAIRLPAQLVQRDLGGSFVLVIGEGDKIERRPVETTVFREGDQVILANGLEAGDRVVASHLQKARPGMTVVPKARPTETPAPGA